MNKNDPNNETKEPTATMNIITLISEMVCVKPAVSEQQGRAISMTLFSSVCVPSIKNFPYYKTQTYTLSKNKQRDALSLADSEKCTLDSSLNFCL